MMTERIVSTTCPFCGVGCKLDLHVKAGQILKATSPYDAVVNHGNLCVKGRFGWDFIYNPQRVTSPMIKRGGRFEPASWDEALDLIADRFAETYRQHGPDALAAFCCAKATNEDNYLLQKLFRAVLRTNNIDHCTRLCHAGSVVALQMAIGSSAMSNTASECVKSDVMIVTGSNTAESHPIIALQMKEAVRRHGVRLIVADPRRVEMVDFADLWLCQRPGTDVALFSAMAHVIVRENLINRDFIEKRTENFETYVKTLEEFTPACAELICGVPAEDIVRAARLYATARRGVIYWALGIPEHTHGTENAMSLIHLALLTGHIGREGTGLNPLRGQNNVQGASDAGAMPWHYPGYQPADDPAVVEKFARQWGAAPAANRGLTTTEIVSAAGAGRVKAMFIMGENPLMSEPNLHHTAQCLQKLEFLVVQDLFINETAELADVFLPAASLLEKEGTITNTDRRVQRVRMVVEPPAQARPDWTIVCDLAKRIETKLGVAHSAYWDFQSPAEVLREMASLVPAYAGITYDRLEPEGLQWPVPTTNHPGTPILFTDTFPRGRGKFHPLVYKPSVESPDAQFPFILTTGRVLYHWHGGTITRHSQIDHAAPEPLVEINPSDASHLHIEDGRWVRVSSRRGAIELRVRVTDKSSRGVVFIPFHYAEAAANLLTNDAVDPVAFIPEYKVSAVNIEIVTERSEA
ncbi:MAG: formate dehydrogenase subunit alpha [Chloroflexi bacterium]|nr:formate dehydrogenase subunit alpha [Chloroflexota bacterium]